MAVSTTKECISVQRTVEESKKGQLALIYGEKCLQKMKKIGENFHSNYLGYSECKQKKLFANWVHSVNISSSIGIDVDNSCSNVDSIFNGISSSGVSGKCSRGSQSEYGVGLRGLRYLYIYFNPIVRHK